MGTLSRLFRALVNPLYHILPGDYKYLRFGMAALITVSTWWLWDVPFTWPQHHRHYHLHHFHFAPPPKKKNLNSCPSPLSFITSPSPLLTHHPPPPPPTRHQPQLSSPTTTRKPTITTTTYSPPLTTVTDHSSPSTTTTINNNKQIISYLSDLRQIKALMYARF